MAEYDNLQLSSDFTSETYAPPVAIDTTNIFGASPTGAFTTFNGDSGAGATGPVGVISGGSTGYEFTAAGASITLILDNAATVIAALGLSKNGTGVIPPAVTDDSAAGYSVNSLFTDTALDDGYMCMDAAVGAAVWKKVTP